jgi:hypothetical protein
VYCEFCVRINLSSDLSTDAYDIITEMEFIALITLAEQAAKVCDRLEECIHQLKAAHEEIDSVHREIQTFSDLMSMFHQALKRPELKEQCICLDPASPCCSKHYQRWQRYAGESQGAHDSSQALARRR